MATAAALCWQDVLLRAPTFGSKFDNTHTYEHALEAGGYILTVHTPAATQRSRAVAILRKHGAHFVNFYGILDVVPILP